MRRFVMVGIGLTCGAIAIGGGRFALGQKEFAASKSSSQVVVDVAKLFQAGKDPVDREVVKAMLVSCAESHAPRRSHDDQESQFYEHVGEFLEYCDTHVLQPSDIDSLREWAANTLDCTGDGPCASPPFMGQRVSNALRCVWHLTNDRMAKCEPRHAVLCSTLCVTLPSYQRLARFADSARAAMRGRPQWDDGTPNVMEAFLLDNQNKGLRTSVLESTEAVFRANRIPEARQWGEDAQRCLDNKNDPNEFLKHLAALMPAYEKTIKGYPSYAVADRYSDMNDLRFVWNAVHAFGNAQAKADFKTFVVSLRDDFGKRGDTAAVKWLTQVMEKPGDPPDRFIYTITIGPPDGQEEK